MRQKSYLAIDIGASGGRHMVGLFDGNTLSLKEFYRFENNPCDIAGTLYWNLPHLWLQVQTGLQAVGDAFGDHLVSIGVDTWGVDFALLGQNDTLLGNPFCYRDARTDGIMEKAFKIVPKNEIFRQSGLQFMQLNTLYQLLAAKESCPSLLEITKSFLMMPDLFHWLLSGEKSNEFTEATTTQFFDPIKNDWAKPMLEQFGLPTEIFQTVALPGTILGPLRSPLIDSTKLTSAKIVLPGSHDTASAVMSVPTESPRGQSDWAYISLGTWALIGIESFRPIINDTVAELDFTNEGGVGGRIQVLKNICGMWLLQECRRTWNQQGQKGKTGQPLDWEDLNGMARNAKPFVSFINPNARMFLGQSDMPKVIAEFCRNTGQPIPESAGAVVRCVLDSLALTFRHVLKMCETIGGEHIKTIHIVGGGTKNVLLCQATADACGCRVVAGPVEATAIGNIMVQAVADGVVANIEEARQVIRSSFEVTEYIPTTHRAEWDDAYERFLKVLQ